jgi:hypothetical protein
MTVQTGMTVLNCPKDTLRQSRTVLDCPARQGHRQGHNKTAGQLRDTVNVLPVDKSNLLRKSEGSEMEAIEQATGEKRVMDVLITPLEEMGLGKPSTILKPDWPRSKTVLCQKLAYMTEVGLVELREWVETHAGGKQRDRFPIPMHITKEGWRIEEPNVGPSPFILSIFRNALGQAALKAGWAPELLEQVKAKRGEWPGPWTVTKIKESADGAMRRLEDIELRLSHDDEISKEDAMWRDQRLAAIRKCQDIADLAQTRTQSRGAA